MRYVTLLLQNDYNIFAITLDGSNKTYLTSDGNADNINTLASWSADGSRIVYTNFKSIDPPTTACLQTRYSQSLIMPMVTMA